ncbi:DNA translocase FtsK [Desulfatibacillum alkenivorans DSM 16219]|jgi:S-DNA-T family DNA segregation ATPase FtsK/SpoIIIE|uniref:DNA translocase FtsK n=1 Tax=Desulfatibacillum alkenivorans DSM 16219 TaxID=1121393 RepID=A0A1M6WRL0_9BACT|nr:DNA translocase FtsK [Desulfatibacillum alkenivorans]SHK96301.1 DNA translocase FtsK [Desulfatibacillum alkenivorans DSM 16219]
MRKEVSGILFLFVIVFTLGALATYTPEDPALFLNIGGDGEINNIFGPAGAHFAGVLIGLFGLGSIWIPVLLLQASIKLLKKQDLPHWLPTVGGAFCLIIATGGVQALAGLDEWTGINWQSGGILGGLTEDALVKALGITGSAIALAAIWTIALIFATGISVTRVLKSSAESLGKGFAYLKNRRAQAKAKKPVVVKAKPNRPKRKKPKQQDPPAIKQAPEQPQPPSNAKNKATQQVFNFMIPGSYTLPDVDMLDNPPPRPKGADAKNLEMQSRLLEKKLEDFGVQGRVSEVCPGPVITTFEYEPGPGVKINRIANLSDDLALALRAMSVRIVAPIPGKAAVGIEIPNMEREFVYFKELACSKEFESSKSRLTLCLGKDIEGNSCVADLAKMPHLLIAGATGSGKSVALNCMIASLLYKASPEEVKLVMIDPKRIELSMFDGIPHLITPVVTDVKKATNALYWAVNEMERRYQAMAEMGARNIGGYNQKVKAALSKKAPLLEGEEKKQDPEYMPYVVVVIDELADLMMVASKDVEAALQRLAQMARAAGIHLILATQRPSVDVLTGTIKANFPTRVSFQVSSRTDSRTILDANGAETLLGMGDMLYLPPGAAKIQRMHGAFVSEGELERILSHVRSQQKPEYDESVTDAPEASSGGELTEEDYDVKYDEAVAIVTETGQASISMIQRRLRIGYNRAARIIEVMEKEGVVGPSDGVKPREVLARSYLND